MTPMETIAAELQGIHDDLDELFAKLDAIETKRRDLLDDYETVTQSDFLEMGGFKHE